MCQNDQKLNDDDPQLFTIAITIHILIYHMFEYMWRVIQQLRYKSAHSLKLDRLISAGEKIVIICRNNGSDVGDKTYTNKNWFNE